MTNAWIRVTVDQITRPEERSVSFTAEYLVLVTVDQHDLDGDLLRVAVVREDADHVTVRLPNRTINGSSTVSLRRSAVIAEFSPGATPVSPEVARALDEALRTGTTTLAESSADRPLVFSRAALDEARRWPNNTLHARPEEPQIPFAATLAPIDVARVDALARFPRFDGDVDAVARQIVWGGLEVVEEEVGFPAALERLEATSAIVRSFTVWLAISERRKVEARATKHKAGGLCPACGARPTQQGGAS